MIDELSVGAFETLPIAGGLSINQVRRTDGEAELDFTFPYLNRLQHVRIDRMPVALQNVNRQFSTAVLILPAGEQYDALARPLQYIESDQTTAATSARSIFRSDANGRRIRNFGIDTEFVTADMHNAGAVFIKNITV